MHGAGREGFNNEFLCGNSQKKKACEYCKHRFIFSQIRNTTKNQKQSREVFYKVCSNLLKKRLHHRFFPVNIAKFLKTPILSDIYEKLLLTHNLDCFKRSCNSVPTFFQ